MAYYNSNANNGKGGRLRGPWQSKDNYHNNPYNFVPLWEKVYQAYDSKEDLPGHDEVYQDRYSGTIRCTFTARTPVCVSNGERDTSNDFFRDAEGKYVLPGSTIKGLVRTNMMILGFGALRPGEDFDDTRMLYRDMASGVESLRGKLHKTYLELMQKNEGNPPKTMLNVSGCYVKCKGRKYTVYRSRFYFVKRYRMTDQEREDYDNACYAVKKKMGLDQRLPKDASGYERKQRREAEKKFKKRCVELKTPYINPLLKGELSRWAIACADEQQVWYQLTENRVTALRDNLNPPKSRVGWKRGILLAPGYMDGQNTLYLFAAFNEQAEQFEWRSEDRLAYEMDYKMRVTGLGGTDTDDKAEKRRRKEFWRLPKKGTAKPFFLRGQWEEIVAPSFGREGTGLIPKNPVALGKSPYHRISYNYPPSHGLTEEHKKAARELTLDYPYAVLGYTYTEKEKGREKTIGFRSRVAVEDFAAQGGEVDSFKLPMGAPKPTSFPDYLLDKKSYNDKQFRLRGIKQYWLHDANNDEKKKDSPFYSDFTVLKEGTRFTGRIRFQNLNREELGLLLWCLKLDEGCFQTVGKGKPYGYGRMSVSVDGVERTCPEKLYSVGSLSGAVTERLDPDEFIEAYIKHMEKMHLDGQPIREQPSISAFLFLHSRIRKSGEVRYMNLNRREYQNRTQPLPTVEEERQTLEQKKQP